MILAIRKSCITGNVVWVYNAPTYGAARVAYKRACDKELERVKHLPKVRAERKRNVMRIINECTADLSPLEPLSTEQQTALKELRRLAEEPIATDLEFYEHIVEERRRQAEDKRIRKEMRERERQATA